MGVHGLKAWCPHCQRKVGVIDRADDRVTFVQHNDQPKDGQPCPMSGQDVPQYIPILG